MVSESTPWLKFWPEKVPRHLDYPEIPVFGLLTKAAERQPGNIAFSCRGVSLNYGELNTQSDRLAAVLQGKGVKKGDRILLYSSNSLQFVVGYYGILKAEAVVVSINPSLTELEIVERTVDSGARMMVANSELNSGARAATYGTGVMVLTLPPDSEIAYSGWAEKLLGRPLPHLEEHKLDPKLDLAAILYTGGTTGLPKGVMLTHFNLVANAMQNAAWFNWTRDDVVIGLLPLYHSWGGSTCVNSPVHAGARVVIIPRFDANELLSTIEKERATILYGAASMFAMLVDLPALEKHDLTSLRYVKAGAMPTPVEIRRKWERITGVKMALGYGLTEASPETHNSPISRIKDGTIGIPLMDTDACIVNPDSGETLPVGEAGELAVKGPQVMRGYWRSDADTSAVMKRGWLHTGDMAVMDEEGYFRIVDRRKDVIKYKGYSLSPGELENVICEHPAVNECVVVGKPVPVIGELPVAYVVLKEEGGATSEEIIEFCAERVAPFKKVREVVFISEIPKTPTGKVSRRLFRDREMSGAVD